MPGRRTPGFCRVDGCTPRQPSHHRAATINHHHQLHLHFHVPDQLTIFSETSPTRMNLVISPDQRNNSFMSIGPGYQRMRILMGLGSIMSPHFCPSSERPVTAFRSFLLTREFLVPFLSISQLNDTSCTCHPSHHNADTVLGSKSGGYLPTPSDLPPNDA
jgi:hypothetical protein